MDDKRFDELIKAKAESHVDTSTPSGAEMSRLFDQLPPPATSWFSSTTNKVVTLASTTLLILTIFLIYRTFRLEESIQIMEDSLQKASFSEGQVVYQYDTAMMDSLATLSYQLNKKLDSLGNLGYQTASIGQINDQSEQVNSEDFANQIMAQLIQEIESNPELMEQIKKQMGIEEIENPSEIAKEVPEDIPPTKENVASSLVENDTADELLKELLKDPDKAKVIENLISGNSPDEQDALTMTVSDQEIESLSDDKKKDVIEKYLAYDPESAEEAARNAGLDSTSVKMIQEYVAITPLESRGIEQSDSLAMADARPLMAEVREEQVKQRNRSLQLGLGGGIGRVPFEGYEGGGTNSIKLTGEYQPNPRFGFATGVEFYSTELETYDINNFDLTRFEDLTVDESEIDEIKLNMQWLDIPLEAKLYFKRGKFSPYAVVSVRARALIKEEFKIEGDDDDITPEFESENKFIIPSYGYGVGSQFYINPKFNGAIQLHHSIGGKGIGIEERQLNTLQLQGILYFDLK